MTDKEILFQAIQKAQKNGFESEILLNPITPSEINNILDTF